MIYFRSDYSQGAHPAVMDALAKTNLEHTDGYGIDEHCERAAEMIRELIGKPDARVHMMIGGTPCNVTFIAANLKPYESVIAARSGHIYVHETGAVEGTGHRVVTAEPREGKLSPEAIEAVLGESQDEHTAMAKMVYISQPTEIGTVYNKAELSALYEYCKARSLILYVDGARLGTALTCDECDMTAAELSDLCDAFYIGGTKNGALFGEALVILRDGLDDHFRWMIKRQCGMLAKGRLIGVQYEALFEKDKTDGEPLYFRIARHSNYMAELLRRGLSDMGVKFLGSSPTNQIFPILPAGVVKKLGRDYFFYEWAPEKDGMIPIRLVTGWGTLLTDVGKFLEDTRLALAEYATGE